MSKRKFEVILKESQQNQKQKQNGIIVYFANRKQTKKKTVNLSNNTNKLQLQRYDSFATNINNFIDKNIKDNK